MMGSNWWAHTAKNYIMVFSVPKLQTVLLIETVHNFIFQTFFQMYGTFNTNVFIFYSTVNRTVRLIEIIE